MRTWGFGVPLAARDRELAEFDRAWARRGKRGVVLAGPAGVGASRLAEECLTRAGGGWRVTATQAVTTPLGAIAHLIPTLRQARAGVVLVDDAQYLDPASAAELRDLLNRDAVCVIATLRTDAPCPPEVAALLDDPRLHRTELAPFDRDQIGDVMQAALGGPLGYRAVSRLFDASGGLVRYLRELTNAALADGALTWDGELWRLAAGTLPRTPALTELITVRLALAPAEARPLLELLALCGRVPVHDADPDALAATAGLIRLDGGVVRLANPLDGEVLRDRMSPLHRHLVLADRQVVARVAVRALRVADYESENQLVPVIRALADLGEFEQARAVARNALATVTSPRDWAWAANFLGRTEWLAGDVQAARRWYAEAIAEAETHHQVQPLIAACAGLAAAAAVLGDLPAAAAALAKWRRFGRAGLIASEERLGEAWLAAGRGELARARAVLVEAAASARATGHRAAELTVLTDLARLGGAAQAVDRVVELAECCPGPLATARSRLVAALATGEPGQLDAAAQALAGLGAYLLAAEAGFAAAAGLPGRAEPAARRARDWAARCPGAVTPGLAMTEVAAALTAREREIALLAAAGDASKAIAAALGVSPRTVENHLARVYAKIGVRGRRELRRAMTTTGQALARSANALASSRRVPTPSLT